MAKQLVNPVERHVEKAVLGVAGLVFLGALAKYLVMSPNATELAGATVAPKEMDKVLAQKAESVRQRLRDHQPRSEDVQSLAEEFKRHLNPFGGTNLGASSPVAVAIGPEVPFIDPVGPTGEKSRLAKVVPVAKPVTVSGRMVAVIPEGAGPELPEGEAEVDWVTVSTLFDREAQTELQRRAYGSKWAEVVFAPAELQRREQRPDGSWSDEDWVDVETWPTARLPAVPEVPLIDDGKQVTVRREDFRPVEKFLEAVKRAPEQLECLRPLPPRERSSQSWGLPVITSESDVSKQDDEYLYAKGQTGQTQAPTFLARYPSWLRKEEATSSESEEELPAKQIAKRFQEAESLMKRAEETGNPQDAIAAYNKYQDIENDAAASSSDRSKARRGKAAADQLGKDIKFGQKKPTSPGTPGVPIAREVSPVQQIWAHDARPGSIVNGKTYQYRIRPVLVNPLVGVPEKFENPQDAKVVLVAGDWSEPSDAVGIEPATRFFVSRSDKEKKEVILDLYQWFRGVWLYHRAKSTVGGKVDITEKMDTPDPDNPTTEVYRRDVRINGDATIVDIDFDRLFRDRQERGGVRIGAAQRTTAVVFMDGQGRLLTRIELADKNDPIRREMKAREWKKPKEPRP